MAAKKKEQEQVAEQQKAITPLQAKSLLALACEMRMHAAEANLAKLTHDVLVAKLDPKGMLAEQDSKFRNSSGEYQRTKAAYDDLKKQIGDTLGVDLSRYSYDEDTGELIPMES